jgi:hypothetical protein
MTAINQWLSRTRRIPPRRDSLGRKQVFIRPSNQGVVEVSAAVLADDFGLIRVLPARKDNGIGELHRRMCARRVR